MGLNYVGTLLDEQVSGTLIRFQRSNNRVEELKDDLDMLLVFEKKPVSRLEVRDAMTNVLSWSRTPDGKWEKHE